MKITFLSLFLFLFVYRATSWVLDIDGKPVQNYHVLYYLIPVSNSGGIDVSPIENNNQTKAVVLNPHYTPGLPVTFQSPFKIGTISEGWLINIEFATTDSSQRYWNVSLEYPVGLTVKVSEETSTFGPFEIWRAGKYYKIMYHHDSSGDRSSADIGIVKWKGLQLLAVNDGHPFVFQIKRATESSSKAGISIV